ncbi:pyridoxal-phosphate dependent enzyme [Polymorphospora rubra]|uniref:Tryptophan synthase beta chain-like PALP domain-containing protein n=1 Tax=Polymorphospora rubra TaxID=338584 RepID=A0A810NAS3_9ACTN|nr:pyridoxal-phosphate dependent enzyme [Polymorphospora rubra]BCJ69199.1 hypothetical protein Prubr_62200 [Polymorphospora rubra]
MLSRVEHLESTLVRTPTTSIVTHWRGRTHHLRLKHESFNPSGSIKDRTAAGLLMAMDRRSPLVPGTVVVESTSGNLGLGMARLLAGLDCRLIAVIDPKTPPATRDALTRAGVQVYFVDEPDGYGGYLLTRLRTVRDLCATNPGYRWPDQYGNYANPWIHQLTTGPEIAEQGGPDLDAVYVAVSTGGTLAGIAAHLRTLDQQIRIIAVDAHGSLVTGAPPGHRLIAGIGPAGGPRSCPSTATTPPPGSPTPTPSPSAASSWPTPGWRWAAPRAASCTPACWTWPAPSRRPIRCACAPTAATATGPPSTTTPGSTRSAPANRWNSP